MIARIRDWFCYLGCSCKDSDTDKEAEETAKKVEDVASEVRSRVPRFREGELVYMAFPKGTEPRPAPIFLPMKRSDVANLNDYGGPSPSPSFADDEKL